MGMQLKTIVLQHRHIYQPLNHKLTRCKVVHHVEFVQNAPEWIDCWGRRCPPRGRSHCCRSGCSCGCCCRSGRCSRCGWNSHFWNQHGNISGFVILQSTWTISFAHSNRSSQLTEYINCWINATHAVRRHTLVGSQIRTGEVLYCHFHPKSVQRHFLLLQVVLAPGGSRTNGWELFSSSW